MPKHDEIFDDGIGNKLRIELYELLDIKPERISYVPTNNNYQEKDFPFDDEVFSLEGDWNLIGSFRQRSTSLMYLIVSERLYLS